MADGFFRPPAGHQCAEQGRRQGATSPMGRSRFDPLSLEPEGPLRWQEQEIIRAIQMASGYQYMKVRVGPVQLCCDRRNILPAQRAGLLRQHSQLVQIWSD